MALKYGSLFILLFVSNSIKSNLRFHLVGENSFAGETNHDYQADRSRGRVKKVLDLFRETLVDFSENKNGKLRVV